MEKIIEALGYAFERVLHSINSAQKLGVVIVLTLLFSCFFLVYQLSQSNELIASIIEPRIERVGGVCYQQQVRGRRLVAIQFPVPDSAIKLGVEQNLSAYLIDSKIKDIQFTALCNDLVNMILDPSIEVDLMNPRWKKQLQEYYNNLDKTDVNSDQRTILRQTPDITPPDPRLPNTLKGPTK